jgi:hypothetical protein
MRDRSFAPSGNRRPRVPRREPDKLGEQKDNLSAQLSEKKDELLEKADRKSQDATDAGPAHQVGGQDAPFMIGD